MAVLQMETEERHQHLVVRLSGELDEAGAVLFRTQVDQLLAENNLTNLGIDLRGLSFIDSSGIGSLLGRYRRLSEQQGRMWLVGAQAQVEGILALSGILRVIPLYETEGQAFNRS